MAWFSLVWAWYSKVLQIEAKYTKMNGTWMGDGSVTESWVPLRLGDDEQCAGVAAPGRAWVERRDA